MKKIIEKGESHLTGGAVSKVGYFSFTIVLTYASLFVN